MTIPALVFGLLAASLWGTLYHLARGGAAWRLFLYLALAWAGFAAGQWLGDRLGIAFFRLGPLNMGAASLGSLLLLALGDWLSHQESRR